MDGKQIQMIIPHQQPDKVDGFWEFLLKIPEPLLWTVAILGTIIFTSIGTFFLCNSYLKKGKRK